MARLIILQQPTEAEVGHTLAEVREAAGRGRACAEVKGGEGKREEAEEDFYKVGARVGEQHAVPRPVHGELDLDIGSGQRSNDLESGSGHRCRRRAAFLSSANPEVRQLRRSAIYSRGFDECPEIEGSYRI